jgi:hypothetical protein
LILYRFIDAQVHQKKAPAAMMTGTTGIQGFDDWLAASSGY